MNLLQALSFLVLAGLLGLAYTLVQDLVTRHYNERTEMRRGNTAAGFNRAGGLIALLLAVFGPLVNNRADYDSKITMFAVDGVVAMVVLIVAHFVMDWVILRKVKNSTALQNGNIAVGVMEFCTYLALGLIISASFSGEGTDFKEGMQSAFAFSFTGLAVLMALYLCYDLLWFANSKRNSHPLPAVSLDRQIGDGNVAAAIDAGSLLVSLGVVLWFSIAGDFDDWATDYRTFGSALVVGLVTQFFARFMWLLVTSVVGYRVSSEHGRHHGNVALSLMTAAWSIGSSAITGMLIFTM